MLSIRSAVVFAILMQNNEGILSKAPMYLLEKLKSCDLRVPEVLLDSGNEAIFRFYAEKWKLKWDTQKDLKIPTNQFDDVTGESKEK